MDSENETRDEARVSVEKAPGAVVINFHGAIVASSEEALVLRETGHPPVLYIPRERVEMAFLKESETRTTCPLKGEARHWSLSAEGQAADDAAWAYEDPKSEVSEIAGHVAFDPTKVTISHDA